MSAQRTNDFLSRASVAERLRRSFRVVWTASSPRLEDCFTALGLFVVGYWFLLISWGLS